MSREWPAARARRPPDPSTFPSPPPDKPVAVVPEKAPDEHLDYFGTQLEIPEHTPVFSPVVGGMWRSPTGEEDL